MELEKMASLGQLLVDIAHEINTPVGVLQSNNDLLLRTLPTLRESLSGLSSDTERQRATAVLDILTNLAEVDRIACQRVSELVKNLRSFAHPEQAERRLFQVQEGIESTLKLVQCKFKDRIRIEKNYAELPPVEGYPNQLNQVFLNLLVNAGEALEGSGAIRITTARQGRNVVIRIADTGKGIPAEYLSRIFEPGFTTKGPGEGTGLGLSISQTIIREHGGTLDVASTVGQGTVFTITLPGR